MKIPFVDLKTQYISIKNDIDSAIKSVILDTAFIGGTNNHYVKIFEEQFASYLKINYCISCANGTDALEILLRAYGISEGDEVIVPALTWISTSEAVNLVGAKPVFVDILPNYYTINPAKIEEKINKKTKAIIPVHLYGMPAEMDEIISIAKKYKLIVIEDCAQAHGAEYKGQKVGTIGHAGSFSFYPGKNLGAYGDSGCMVTNDKNIADRARMITNHGQIKKHEHQIIGRNSRMDGIQAAILIVKLAYLNQWIKNRINNARFYDKYFFESKIETPSTPEYSKHAFHLYVIQTDYRNKINSLLKKNQIATGIHYPTPLPFLKVYSHNNYIPSDFPVAYEASNKILSLPMFPELEEAQIKYITDVIKSYFSKYE
ncbi:DegT/DnrJ/EryC1/StrS family aminotransferase [Patescibacteria group bacterium]